MSLELAFHHVGVGTVDFDRTIDTYVALGHTLFRRVDDPGINVRIAFLACPGDTGPWIEILSPLGPEGPLQSLIRRKLLPSPYHTCYAVAQLEAGAQRLESQSFIAVGVPQEAIAFDGARVQFFYHACLGLIELVEAPPVWRVT